MWNRISTDFVRDLSLNPEEESKTYELLVDVLKKIRKKCLRELSEYKESS